MTTVFFHILTVLLNVQRGLWLLYEVLGLVVGTVLIATLVKYKNESSDLQGIWFVRKND